jgi:hypothetical protein
MWRRRFTGGTLEMSGVRYTEWRDEGLPFRLYRGQVDSKNLRSRRQGIGHRNGPYTRSSADIEYPGRIVDRSRGEPATEHEEIYVMDDIESAEWLDWL